ncbi:hypothetical protein F511_36265 [Dorcoceras hygrometricum]|uniref:Uncharacterized protein n=1 Tax=Dorcoceras hygrometricum TaxID=472368 RepID=A0A2Z7CU60_9LAMI|nr:hypothetical protein F511_36265 [Dorcoceras hygrometricum]
MFAQPVSKTQQSTAQQFVRAVASDRPSSAQRLAQDSRPSRGHQAQHRAAVGAQLRAGVAAVHGGGRRPSSDFFFVSIDSKFEIQMQYGSIVLKDPSHSSDTTVGEPWRIRIPSPGETAVDSSIRSTTGRETPSSACTRRPDEISTDGFSSKGWPEQLRRGAAAAARGGHGGDDDGGLERREGQPALEGLTRSARTDSPRKVGRSNSGEGRRRRRVAGTAATTTVAWRGGRRPSRTPQNPPPMLNTLSSVSVRESRIQYLCDPQWFRDIASRGPTTIVAPESQFRTCPSDHDNIGYPRMSASGESSTTMHRLLHASGSHPILPPNDPKLSCLSLVVRMLCAEIDGAWTGYRADLHVLGLIRLIYLCDVLFPVCEHSYCVMSWLYAEVV